MNNEMESSTEKKTRTWINEVGPLEKDDTLSKEEELEYFRQRYNVLKAVKDKYQEELTVYKTKVQGVDSVILLLKEARQENVNFHKRNKALEAAVTNLQRRLSKNGLSNSLNLQDTELFVPGASKQTLDNLAKENVRLRNLLKNGSGQCQGKASQEFNDMKSEKERLESENSILKRDLQSYEQRLIDLTREREMEKTQLEQEKARIEDTKNRQHLKKIETVSFGCQASDFQASSIQELRETLKVTVQHCNRLDEQLHQLPQISSPSEEDKVLESTLKTPVLVDEDYQKIKTQLDEAVLMNQRWQAYSQNQNHRIQVLSDDVLTLKKAQDMNVNTVSTHQEEEERLRVQLAMKDSECQELRKQATSLSREVQHYRREMSTVEILKQQIQVCTEDFNTERKDREQAVARAKALQDENNKLNTKVDRLKHLNKTELMNHFQPSQHPSSAIVQPPMRRYELLQDRGTSGKMMTTTIASSNVPPYMPPSMSENMPARQHMASTVGISQGMSEAMPLSHRIPFSEYNSMADRNVVPILSQGQRIAESHSLPRELLNEPNQSLAGPGISSAEQSRVGNNLSMPTLTRRGGSPNERQQLLACPKCNKEFPEKNSTDLLTHIDMCNA